MLTHKLEKIKICVNPRVTERFEIKPASEGLGIWLSGSPVAQGPEIACVGPGLVELLKQQKR